MQSRYGFMAGVLLTAFVALLAVLAAKVEIFERAGLSPLIIAIVFGMIYANTSLAKRYAPGQSGIAWSSKTLLRVAIVLYGFHLTFGDLELLGAEGFIVGAFMMLSTFALGYLIAVKWLKLEKDLALLICAGSSICGAAAVMATDFVLRAKAYKAAVAVGTVVFFGTLGMFLYPLLYQSGVLGFEEKGMGIYIGATLHEVAHVAAAGNAVGESAADAAVAVKMFRVMLLVPFLLLLAYMSSKKQKGTRAKITVPWFALLFLGVIALNSFSLLPGAVHAMILQADTFMLTMAMAALGMQTGIEKFQQAGVKPLGVALVMFVWLVAGGYTAVYLLL